MGQTLEKLSQKQLDTKAIFNNRFVIEVCENIHFHYRNLRIIMSLQDWLELAQGCVDSIKRWKDRASPEPVHGTHIELCRKSIAKFPIDDDKCRINLNNNLYPHHKGRIFSEGSGFSEPTYIHLKWRDLRLELSLGEFNQLAEAVQEAKEKLCNQV